MAVKEGLLTIERTVKCACCMCKKPVPKDHKETASERKERLEKNEEAREIHYIRKVDGKIVEERGEFPYYYKKKPYHYYCLLVKLNKEFKKDQKKVDLAMNKAIENREKAIDEARKKGVLMSSEVKTAKTTKESRDKLVNYFMGHYATKSLGKKINSLIKSLNEGTSLEYNNVKIEYEKLLDMFLYYEKDLLHIAESKRKKGENFVNPSQHILYDISCVVANIDDYDNKEAAIYSKQTAQQDEREEILDVKKYRLDLNNDNKNNNSDEINTANEAIKRAEEFAEEYTKEYDDKYGGIFEGLFDDDI